MTAAERLKQLSGLSAATAAAMLLAIGSGATAGDLLVSSSPLSSATAAEHLLADRAAQQPSRRYDKQVFVRTLLEEIYVSTDVDRIVAHAKTQRISVVQAVESLTLRTSEDAINVAPSLDDWFLREKEAVGSIYVATSVGRSDVRAFANKLFVRIETGETFVYSNDYSTIVALKQDEISILRKRRII